MAAQQPAAGAKINVTLNMGKTFGNVHIAGSTKPYFCVLRTCLQLREQPVWAEPGGMGQLAWQLNNCATQFQHKFAKNQLVALFLFQLVTFSPEIAS